MTDYMAGPTSAPLSPNCSADGQTSKPSDPILARNLLVYLMPGVAVFPHRAKSSISPCRLHWSKQIWQKPDGCNAHRPAD